MKKLFIIIAILVWAGTAWAGPLVQGSGTSSPASETVAGVTEYCTDAEYTAGAKTDCAGTAANAKVELDKKQNAATGLTASKPVCTSGTSTFAVCAGTEGVWATAASVVDWTADQGATNIHAGNIPDLSGTYQAADADLTALAGVTSAANAIPYFTGSGTAGVISSSANMVSFLGSADYETARTNMGTWGVSGSITDEQLVCGETTGGTNLLKSCGAKVTYTEPASNLPICRTGAGTTGACTNIVIEKIAVFHWGDGVNAVAAAASTKVCADVEFTATITKIKLTAEASPSSDVTVTLVKDAQADDATANATTAFNVISDSNVVTLAGAGSVLAKIYTSFTATAVTAGDQICATITATDTLKWLHLTVSGTR